MLDFLAKRRRENEWMDEPGVDPEELHRALIFIRRINRFLGYTRASIHHLERFSRDWKSGQQIMLLDVATGSADVPVAMLAWAGRFKFDLHIVAVDLHKRTTALAAKAAIDEPNLQILRADATALPFADHSFDYAHTAMFLHHLDEPTIINVLKEMKRVSRRGVIVADLVRERQAYVGISLLTAFASPMIRHDAKVSVAQAFRLDEMMKLCQAAGLMPCSIQRHRGSRFVIEASWDGRPTYSPGGSSGSSPSTKS